MNRVRALTSLAAAAALLAIAAVPAAAGKPGQYNDSTVGGYHTYDADMINIENVTEDGDGVYVAVLDTGLVSNWSDYFPKARIAASLGIGFNQNIAFKATDDPCRVEADVNGEVKTTSFIGSISSSHGTHVTSTIIGYNYYSNSDASQGYPLPAIQVRGIAPNVTIIPVKVLADYQLPRMPKCDDPDVEQGAKVTFGTDDMVAAGINYVTDLATGPLDGSRVVINMSLGGDELAQVEKDAIDNAIAAGVVIVAAAGNEGDDGMHFPGAYAPVISAGSVGWADQWLDYPGDQALLDPPDDNAADSHTRYRMWWLQSWFGDGTGSNNTDFVPPLNVDSGNLAEPTTADDVFVSDFSSRSLNADQDLDVLAPGDWVRGPFGGDPGYNHLPWWSRGIADLISNNSGNFYYVGGTSMATPHVAAVAALMLEQDDSLSASDIETQMEATALAIPAGSAQIWDPFKTGGAGWHTYTWGANATGAGLLQADAALGE